MVTLPATPSAPTPGQVIASARSGQVIASARSGQVIASARSGAGVASAPSGAVLSSARPGAGGAGARVIWLVDLDAFYVSVERRRDPSLRGKAVIVGHASSERGVVCSASYEARAFGVRSAMPMARALAACPRAVVVAPDFPAYEAASEDVFRRLRAVAPVLERVSIDEAYLDFTGAEPSIDALGTGRDAAGATLLDRRDPSAGPCESPAVPLGWVDVAASVRSRLLADTGLSVSIGIGSSKSVAKVAANLAKPGGVLEVARGHEAAFLAGLPVDALPGVGPKTRERLAALRIHAIGDLARVPAAELETSLGAAGAALVRRARGLDDEPVDGGPRTPRSVSRETTFAADTADERVITATLGVLARSAGATLRGEGLFAGAVVVKWRDAEFRTFTARTRLPAPTNRDVVLLDAVDRLRRRRHDPRRRLRLVGVSLADLCADSGHQLDLFD